MTSRFAGVLGSLLLPALAFAQQTPGVKWKTPASWNIDMFGGRTYSTVTIVNGDPARDAPRAPGWVAGATFGRYDGKRVGFSMQVLGGRQRATERLFDPARPANYSLRFIEVPLLLRFDPFRGKNSGGLVSVFGGVGIGRRFHLERTFDAHTSTARWAMYSDAIAGASVDLRRAIVNIEYLNGLTKFAPASGPSGAKHLRSLLVTAGYEVKRGPVPHATDVPWEVELHGGGLIASRATAGSGALPASGPTFAAAAPGLSSRRVSTWFASDGAALFNQTIAAFPIPPPAIAPLDNVLVGAAAQRGNGGIVGIQLTRPVTSRVSAELALDLSDTPVTLVGSALAQIEASRASFADGFAGLFTMTGITSAGISATTELHDGQGKQVIGTAGALVRLTRERKITPFARGGVGMFVARNGTRAIVRGVYDFRSPAGVPFREIDTVTIKFSSGSGLVGHAGGGLTVALTERTGIRFDADIVASRNRLKTTLTTAPVKNSTSAPFGVFLITASDAAIQFSNFNSTTTPSSLSGTPLQDFETFRGRGLQLQTAITVGIYRRF